MIWVLELVVLLVFVGFGGFEGFIAWAVLTALIMFARHSQNQTKLKQAELMMQAEKDKAREERALGSGPSASSPGHVWIDSLGNELNFRSMMWGRPGRMAAQMVRRVSATEWQTKLDADYQRSRIAELKKRLAKNIVQGPAYEPCSECGTHGGLEPLHRASCAKYNEADEEAARARDEDESEREIAADELQAIEMEAKWITVPEKLIAPIETAYQRYLAHSA